MQTIADDKFSKLRWSNVVLKGQMLHQPLLHHQLTGTLQITGTNVNELSTNVNNTTTSVNNITASPTANKTQTKSISGEF